MSTPELITAKETAKLLNVSLFRMYELLNSSDFPTVVISQTNGRKYYRVNKSKLMQWIEKGGLASANA